MSVVGYFYRILFMFLMCWVGQCSEVGLFVYKHSNPLISMSPHIDVLCTLQDCINGLRTPRPRRMCISRIDDSTVDKQASICLLFILLTAEAIKNASNR